MQILFKNKRSQTIFWFSLSLMLAIACNVLILQRAFGGEYVVQDDVRQHVFWMLRFIDPTLFPHDLIADYFQSLAPWGYRQLYHGFAAIGLNPLTLSKLLPVVLSLLTASYAFGVAMQLLPVPFAGFIASALTSQVLWTHDDVVSATPRAFLPPLFLAFLYYVLRQDAKPFWRRSLLPCLIIIALEGLFYPQYVLVFAGIAALQVMTWRREPKGSHVRWSHNRQDYWFAGACLGAAFLVLLPIALSSSPYGAVITGAEARKLPEFLSLGRNRFFGDDPLRYWLTAERSGLFPNFRPWFLAIGAFLPLPLLWARRHPAQFPLIRQVSPKTIVLIRVAIVAVVLFFMAHALLFKLYLPSRYTEYTLRFVLVFATAIVITLLLQAAGHWLEQYRQRLVVWALTAVLGAILLLYPLYSKDQARSSYWSGENPQLYQFLAEQPKDILIASLVREVDNVPTFAQRSLLISREYALPYHVGYGSQFRQRVVDTIQAQYTLDPAVLADVIRTYGIDFWIVDQSKSFDANALLASWIRQYPEAIAQARSQLAQGTPVLKKLAKSCTVSRDQDLRVLSADCILGKL